MAHGRPRHRFLLFDLPSDHEVDDALSTECEVIRAILCNRNLGSRVRTVRATTERGLLSKPATPSKMRFVHLACHGGEDGIGLIGGSLQWSDVGTLLRKHLKPLGDDERRVLSLSCCHSGDGIKALRSPLSGYFSAFYYFHAEEVDFATAMTTWAMFYRKKTMKEPHKKIRDAINEFFGDEVLAFSTA